jgi:integrating conjugative element protein (TIGR03746 family)
MMRFQHALANAWLSIKILWVALGCLLIINLALIISWHQAQKSIRVYIPPQIPSSGITQNASSIPLSSIYSFAFYIWQGVNYWPENGLADYKKAIEQFAPFLTPKFKQVLLQDYRDRQTHGELQDRLRHLQGASGSSFDVREVETVGHDTWLVHLQMRLSEHMNMNGNAVKDVVLNYTLRVVRYDANPKVNPWGLALDGFVENPERVHTYI